MTAESSDKEITAAFKLLLDGLKARHSNLTAQLSPAGEAGRHDAVTKINNSLKRTSTLISSLEKLQSEWGKEATPQPPKDSPQKSYTGPTKFDLCIPTLQALENRNGQGNIIFIRDKVISLLSLPPEITTHLNPKRN